jgi:hypothetical protein
MDSSYRTLSDRELLLRIERGDDRALKEFITRAARSPYAFDAIEKRRKQERLNAYAVGYAEGTGRP